MNEISWDEFLQVDLRVGTIIAAKPNTKARKPAYVLTVDLGELGVKTSSAQLTHHYSPDVLIGKQVLCVCNFPPKHVAGVRSEVLITGAYDNTGNVALAEFPLPVPCGSRLV